MITEDMIIKIGDFGLSKYFKSPKVKLQTNCGSPCYSAPEVLKGNRYSPIPVDIWGIGIILYCMVCGELPFEDEREDILIRKVTLCNYTCPIFVNQIFKNLFKRILCPNPNERLSIDKIKMNCVYNMGRANFYKYFKIYGEDGDLLPQVKAFIKKKALKSLEVAYAMEISKDSVKLPGYKIYFRKYMHEIPWSQYYIPQNKNEEGQKCTEEQLTKFRKNKKFRNFSFDKKNCDKYKNNNKNNDILYIPEHESINDAIYQEEKKNQNIKIPSRNIPGIIKLGVLSNSFDENFDYKAYNNNKENNNEKNNEINEAK
jgi:serine/threonine protein kinase